MAEGYARGRIRDDEARERLEPLAPGERPKAVTVAAIASAVLAVANVAAAPLVDDRSNDEWRIAVMQAIVLLIAGAGMWRGKYWAVLGFQILLGIAVVYAGLSLLVASNVAGALLALAIMVSAGTLFWFLVRSLARLQMPRRPGDRRLG
jgi:hypothetical protein